jgi:hypothetical protein
VPELKGGSERCPRVTRTLVALAWGLVLAASPAARLPTPLAEAQRPAVSRSGTLGGADYLIEVPADWNSGLVVFAHGIQRGPGRGDVHMPPIASHITAGGYAWIASGYRAREYQPHGTALSIATAAITQRITLGFSAGYGRESRGNIWSRRSTDGSVMMWLP